MKKIVLLAVKVSFLVTVLIVLSMCGKNADPRLICGVTEYPPLNYMEGSDWTGFETEFARLVGKKLGMAVEFQKIEWTRKFIELEAGTINCIWNGLTANTTDSTTGRPRHEDVDFSYSYMFNQQSIVIKADRAGEFTVYQDLSGKTAAAEKGSAGESAAKDAVGDGGKVIDSTSQVDTFIEVKSGAVDYAVVDIILAQQMTGSGNYNDLVIADITLDHEMYAVGFKKGSDLTEKVNKTMEELFAGGEMLKLAQKYGLENSLYLDKSKIE